MRFDRLGFVKFGILVIQFDSLNKRDSEFHAAFYLIDLTALKILEKHFFSDKIS